MGYKTAISWTNATWNPVTGCIPVTEGCRNCYAARYAKRRIGDFHNGRPFSVVRCHHERLDQPLHWRKPRRIFVCSMGDLFHDDVPFDFIHEVWDVFKRTPQHIYQVLTKRPQRMRDCIEKIYSLERMGWASGFWNHVWLGVTTENQAAADERIPLLLQTPAAVRFVSCEPLLDPIDIRWAFHKYPENHPFKIKAGLDWLIAGGESGPSARPMHPDWVRSLRDQCQAHDIPFHFKSWGEFCWPEQMPEETFRHVDAQVNLAGIPEESYRVGRKAAGRMLDDREYLEFPEIR